MLLLVQLHPDTKSRRELRRIVQSCIDSDKAASNGACSCVCAHSEPKRIRGAKLTFRMVNLNSFVPLPLSMRAVICISREKLHQAHTAYGDASTITVSLFADAWIFHHHGMQNGKNNKNPFGVCM